jgi:transposase-like protein
MSKLEKAGGEEEPRRHSLEFKIEIAQRMLAGESSAGLSRQYRLPRSMMYRWRNAYREHGSSGLQKRVGRPPGQSPGPASRSGTSEEKLLCLIADLEQKVGRQAVENDFLKRVFKRVSELPKASGRGGNASTAKSDG